MVKHQQAIAIIGNAPPVRFSYPPQARFANAPLSAREKQWLLPAVKTSPPMQTNRSVPSAPTVLVGDTRPAFSYGQLLNQKLTFQPEYDPAQLTAHFDPSISDAPAATRKPEE